MDPIEGWKHGRGLGAGEAAQADDCSWLREPWPPHEIIGPGSLACRRPLDVVPGKGLRGTAQPQRHSFSAEDQRLA